MKRLFKEGWLKIKEVKNRNIPYIVSPQGMDKIARHSYRFLLRTIKNIVY